MKTQIGVLGELEWVVMKTCWKKGQSTARVIFDEISKIRKTKYQTIKTTLDRLAKKGYLSREKFGPLSLFSPKVTEKALTSKAIENFAQTVFGNTIAPIFIHLLKKKKYSHELEELKQLIDEIEEEE